MVTDAEMEKITPGAPSAAKAAEVKPGDILKWDCLVGPSEKEIYFNQKKENEDFPMKNESGYVIEYVNAKGGKIPVYSPASTCTKDKDCDDKDKKKQRCGEITRTNAKGEAIGTPYKKCFYAAMCDGDITIKKENAKIKCGGVNVISGGV